MSREYLKQQLDTGYIGEVNEELERRLTNIYDYGFFFDTINSITEQKEEVVYDIEVEKDHSFIANGFVVHNCHRIKNQSSSVHQAVMHLSGVAYRRLATGTLITNTPFDLVGQLEFIDPMIVGDRKEFEARYAVNGPSSRGWRQN